MRTKIFMQFSIPVNKKHSRPGATAVFSCTAKIKTGKSLKTKPLTDILNIKNKEINQWIEISMKNEDCCIINKQFKDKLMVYFNKIKISKENNIFKFYLNDNIIKLKYSKIPNLIYQKYACMIQNYILDYESTEDTISITIFGKMKVEYSNKIQLVFEEFIPRIISYMETIFKLVDYLLKNNSVPEIKLCPLYTYIQSFIVDFLCKA